MNKNAQETELRAYELWEARGRPHGSAEDDWYQAEREVATSSEGQSDGTGDGKESLQADNPVQGEGDYEAAQRYRADVQEFVAQSDTEQLAHDAEPDSDQQALELTKAEKKGKSRSKGDDPADVGIMYADPRASK
jgi:FtsZ-interacting cell division protein ZipA